MLIPSPSKQRSTGHQCDVQQNSLISRDQKILSDEEPQAEICIRRGARPTACQAALSLHSIALASIFAFEGSASRGTWPIMLSFDSKKKQNRSRRTEDYCTGHTGMRDIWTRTAADDGCGGWIGTLEGGSSRGRRVGSGLTGERKQWIIIGYDWRSLEG
jgi:hypothetical protein